MNRLYFGDNLEWLRDWREFPDASIDLVYLDPPFNSNADYNVLWQIVGRLCQTPNSLRVELKLVWPVVCMFDKAGAHLVPSQVFPFFRQGFIRSQ